MILSAMSVSDDAYALFNNDFLTIYDVDSPLWMTDRMSVVVLKHRVTV